MVLEEAPLAASVRGEQIGACIAAQFGNHAAESEWAGWLGNDWHRNFHELSPAPVQQNAIANAGPERQIHPAVMIEVSRLAIQEGVDQEVLSRLGSVVCELSILLPQVEQWGLIVPKQEQIDQTILVEVRGNNLARAAGLRTQSRSFSCVLESAIVLVAIKMDGTVGKVVWKNERGGGRRRREIRVHRRQQIGKTRLVSWYCSDVAIELTGFAFQS